MKKNYLKIFGSLAVTILLIAGCQKENKELNAVTNEEGNATSGFHRDECRLVSNISEFAELTYTYNQIGLVDQENLSYFENGKLKMEYDAKGRLVKSRLYSGDVLLNTIIFFYVGDRVVKETWYDGDTQVKVDEVFYSYNSDGKVWRSQSFIGDYTSFYNYTADGGSVDGWKFYVGGKLNYAQEYTYLPPHHKDPSSARPGLDYDFISPNGRVSQSRWYSTSEKDISYDENGENPVVLLDQDPSKSVVTFSRHNYVTGTDFFDNLSQTWVHFRFAYENCGGDDGIDIAKSTQKLPFANNKISPLRFLKIGSTKSMKEQLRELRTQYVK